MAWAKAGTNTLTSTTDPINVTFTEKTFLQTLSHDLPTTTRIQPQIEFNSDGASTNYAARYSSNGGNPTSPYDTTQTSTASGRYGAGTTVDWEFIVGNIINIATEEKLMISFCIYGSDGAGTAPNRQETITKWANTSAQINEIDDDNEDTGDYGGYASDSNLTILGTD